MGDQPPRTIHCSKLGPSKPGSPLATEWDCYRREVARLLADGLEGKFVLIKGDAVQGQYPTEEQAQHEGRRRFLLQPFLVHHIQTWERVYRAPWAS
jgi:hypothetical protein